MALNGIPIIDTQEIGDSLSTINNAFTALDQKIDQFLPLTGGLLTGSLTGTSLTVNTISAARYIGDGGGITGLVGSVGGGAGVFTISVTTPIVYATDVRTTILSTVSLSATTLYGNFVGDGSKLTNLSAILGGGGTADALPLSGGSVYGNVAVGDTFNVGTSAFVPTIVTEVIRANYDNLYSSVKFLTRNNGAIGALPVDIGPNAATITLEGTTGTVGLSSKYVKYNKTSLYFLSGGYIASTGPKSANKHVKVAANNLLEWGNGNGTIEFWIYVGSYPDTSGGSAAAQYRFATLIETFSKNSNSNANAFCLGLKSDGTIALLTTAVTTAGIMPLRKWTHVALQKYNGSLYLSIDGGAAVNMAVGPNMSSSDNAFYIGGSTVSIAAANLNGGEYSLTDTAISEIRCTTGTARYDGSGFTIPPSYFPATSLPKITLDGDLLVTGSLSALGDITFLDTIIATTSAMAIDTSGTADALRITQRGTGNVLRVEDEANPDTTPFIIDNVGNVGIGTSAPTAKLDVNGITNLRSQVNFGSALVQNIAADATNLYLRGAGIAFQDAAATTTKMFIDASGNVGIGTTSAVARLHVVSSVPKVLSLFSTLTSAPPSLDHGEIIHLSHSSSVNGMTFSGSDPRLMSFGNTSNGGYIRSNNVNIVSTNDTIFANGALPESVRITSAGAVGIGTSTPNAPLGVAGAVLIGNQLATGTTGSLRILNSFGVNYIQSGLNVSSGSSAPLVFGDIFASQEWMRIAADGKVGIGTNAPVAKFHVLGGASTMLVESAGQETVIDFKNTSTTGRQWRVGTGGSAGGLGNGRFGFYDVADAAMRMVLLSGGNVGIGTSTPIGNLEVAGNSTGGIVSRVSNASTTGGAAAEIHLATGIANVYVINQVHNGSSAPYYYTGAGAGINASYNDMPVHYFRDVAGSNRLVISSSGTTVSNALQVLRQDNVNEGADIGLARASDNAMHWHIDVLGSTITPRLRFFQEGGVGERMTIMGDTGYVGIGTAAPRGTLDITGGTLHGVNNIFGHAATNAYGIYSDPIGTYNNGSWIQMYGSTVVGDPKTIHIGTNGVERMRIASDGNVGIGTSSPSQKLEIAGSVLATVDQNAATRLIATNTNQGALAESQIRLSSYGNYWDIANGSTAKNANSLTFSVNGSTELFRITSSGKVGIGTASPAQHVHIKSPQSGTPSSGAGLVPLLIENSSAKSSQMIFGVSHYLGDYNPLTQTGDQVIIFKGDSTIADSVSGNLIIGPHSASGYGMRLTYDGKVGIGTASPRNRLDLGGGTIAGVTNIKGHSNSGAYSIWGGLGTDSAQDGGFMAMYGSTHATNPYLLQIGNSNAGAIMSILSGGNVGVGITTPAAKLEVAGTLAINAAGYAFLRLGTVTNSGWAITKETSDDSFNIFQGAIQGSPVANRLRISSAGNVGIGTTTPNQKLTVVGNISASGILYGDGSNLTGVLRSLPAVGTFTTSVSAPSLSGTHYGDGSNLSNLLNGGVQYKDVSFSNTWKETNNAGVTYKVWTCVAMSDNGAYQTAAGDAEIFRSLDYGLTWNVVFPVTGTLRTWNSIAMTPNGSKQVVTASDNGIWISTDYGATWNITSAPSSNMGWSGVDISSNGLIITATTYGGTSGRVYVSSDGGTTWTVKGAANGLYSGIAMSSNGSLQVAVSQTAVYVSSDAGLNWVPDINFGSYSYPRYVCMSADGTRILIAQAYSNLVISTDSGASWVGKSAPSDNVTGISMSPDGQYILWIDLYGAIYESKDFGVTFSRIPGVVPAANYAAISLNGVYKTLMTRAYSSYVNVRDKIFPSVNIAVPLYASSGNINVTTVTETLNVLTSGVATVAIDLYKATFFTLNLTINITSLTFTNAPVSPKVFSFALLTIGDGISRSVAWPTSIKWQSGIAPTITFATGKIDTYSFLTYDGGTTWLGSIAAQNQ